MNQKFLTISTSLSEIGGSPKETIFCLFSIWFKRTREKPSASSPTKCKLSLLSSNALNEPLCWTTNPRIRLLLYTYRQAFQINTKLLYYKISLSGWPVENAIFWRQALEIIYNRLKRSPFYSFTCSQIFSNQVHPTKFIKKEKPFEDNNATSRDSNTNKQ